MNKKYVALTFDDGPNNVVTPMVLDRLEKYGIKATFMLCGKNISEETKDVMQRQLSLGCEFANHGLNHLNMADFDQKQIDDELQTTQELVFKYVGVYPKIFRPPYIRTSDFLLNNCRLIPVNGVGCSDWDANVSEETTAEEMIKNAKAGDILLLHDFAANAKTARALDKIIPALKEAGFEFVTVSELFEKYDITIVKGKMYSNVIND